MDGPVGVCGSKAADKMVLECLDGAFGHIESMDIWFHEFQFAFRGLEENLEGRSCLIVGDIGEGGGVPF